MPYIHKDKDKIFYNYEPSKKNKNAELIILIHGNCLNHTSFDVLVPLLNANYNVLRYDLRGHGQSDLGSNQLTWEVYIEDLLVLIQSLNIESFHLVGHGFGSNIAVKFAVLNADLIKSIVLLSMPAYYPQHLAEKAGEHRRLLATDGSLLPLAEYLLKLITVLPMDHPEIQKILMGYSKGSLLTYFQIVDLTVSSRPVHELTNIDTPTLIMAGEHDIIFPPYLSSLAAFYLPKFNFYIVPGASNMMFLDQTEVTADWIQRFIQTSKEESLFKNEFQGTVYEEIRLHVQKVIEEGEKIVSSSNQLKVELLHFFRVFVNGEEILEGWNQRSAKQILVYLLFHRSVTREQLCDTLWADIPFSKSRNRLRVYLSYLNGLLNKMNNKHPFLITDNDHIYLKGFITCDGIDFIEQINQAYDEKEVRKKILLCQKVFGGIPTNIFNTVYDDWFLELRERTENRLMKLAEWLADQHIHSGAIDEAINCLKNAINIRPDDVTLYEKLIECYQIIDDKSNIDFWVKQKEKSS